VTRQVDIDFTFGDEEVTLEITFSIQLAEPDVGIMQSYVSEWYVSATYDDNSVQHYEELIRADQKQIDRLEERLNEIVDEGDRE
jgi:hypothetical protein